jgi:AcrR family transcriptional regulator
MKPSVREQLGETMLRELGERGRDGLSLEAVLSEVDVSAEEFAAEYADIGACLDAAYGRLTMQLEGAVRVGCASDGDGEAGWPARVGAGLEALLAELAASPEAARALIRGYPALGPVQQARYQGFVESFAAQLRRRRETGGFDGELPTDVDSLAVGAAEAIIFEEISSDRTEGLPKMGPSILFSVLVPFLGTVAAAAEMRNAQN